MHTDYDNPDSLAHLAASTDISDIAEMLDLPDLPDRTDGTDNPVELFIRRYRQENIVLRQGISAQDAQAYCSRDDTAGWYGSVHYRAY